MARVPVRCLRSRLLRPALSRIALFVLTPPLGPSTPPLGPSTSPLGPSTLPLAIALCILARVLYLPTLALTLALYR